MFAKIKDLSLIRLVIMTMTIAIIKLILHYINFEPFSFGLSTLFTSALMGTIFLLGFILAGVLTDYKESERIPTEMLACLSSMWMEARVLLDKAEPEEYEIVRQKLLLFLKIFREDFLIRRLDGIFMYLDSFSEVFAKLDHKVPPPFMAKFRTDHQNLGKLLSRIKTIRDTSFSIYGYVILRVVIAFFIFALLLAKIDPFVEGLFFLCFFSFVLIGVFTLIRDMDNPFEYSRPTMGKDEVSFEEITVLEARITGERSRIK
jgi:hypothetical protein